METSSRPARRSGGSAVLVGGAVIGLLAAGVGIVFAVVNVAVLAYSPEFVFQSGIVTEQVVALERDGSAAATFNSVQVVATDGVDGARTALAASLVAQYGLFIAVALAVAGALWSLSRGHDFSRTATRLLLVLGVAVSVLSLASSGLDRWSTRLAVASLGLPTSPAATGDWILEPGIGLDRHAILLATVGVALIVAGMYFRAGSRIRHELSDVI